MSPKVQLFADVGAEAWPQDAELKKVPETSCQ